MSFRFLMSAALLLLCTSATLAQDCFTLCDPCVPVSCNKKTGKKTLLDSLSFYGWVQAGIHGNQYGTANGYAQAGGALSPASQNLTPYSGNSYLLMTGQPSDFKVNQLWFGVAKRLDTKHGFDWGFQCDTVFGTDAKYCQAFGDQTFDYGWNTGDYYLAIPQLYAEVGYHQFKLRAGKFAATMVHEALPAPMTFFYSHSYLCYNTPLTYSGVTGEWQVGKKLTLSTGWTAGEETTFTNRLGDNSVLGAVTYRATDAVSLSYNMYHGWYNGLNKRADARIRFGRAYDSSTQLVQTFDVKWQMNKKLFYLLEGLYRLNDMAWASGPGDYEAKAYGIHQQLLYTINPRWAVGLRGEWHHAQGTIFDIPAGGFSGGAGGDLYAITLGANWNPLQRLNIRPELRYDWTDYKNGFQPFNNQTQTNQLSGGCAMMVKW